MGTACSWVGLLQSSWRERKHFCFSGFLLKLVFFSFVGCVRVRTGWLYSQQVSYKITAGSCDCVLLSKSFSNWAFNVFHTWFGTNCRGNCETLFSIQGGGKRHLFFSSSLQRACVRPEFAGSSYCRLQPSTVAPLASSSLLRQHVGADLVNGWLRWVALTMLLWSVWCCACCFLYTGAVVTADGDCAPCVNRPG